MTDAAVTPQDAAGDGAACPSGAITFALRASEGTFCVGAQDSCSHDWISLVTGDGSAVVIDEPCVTRCDSCEPIACPASCAAPTPLGPAGVQRTWSGTAFRSSTCGAGEACVEPTCAPAGQYVARMCAFREEAPGEGGGFCSAAPTPTCVDVAFDWPPAGAGTTLEGTIGTGTDAGVDAGACCPAGWFLYDCAWPDGGVGHACHNPALGCASSLTCGVGCDAVVVGRCGGG